MHYVAPRILNAYMYTVYICADMVAKYWGLLLFGEQKMLHKVGVTELFLKKFKMAVHNKTFFSKCSKIWYLWLSYDVLTRCCLLLKIQVLQVSPRVLFWANYSTSISHSDIIETGNLYSSSLRKLPSTFVCVHTIYASRKAYVKCKCWNWRWRNQLRYQVHD